MKDEKSTLNLNRSVVIGEGIHWVGVADEDHILQCNPYLIIEGDEGVLIDGGNRTDFSRVMLKILQTGLHPSHIRRLIYSHYDPDLCGSILDIEEIIDNKRLRIITLSHNSGFIKYYGGHSPIQDAEAIDMSFTFKSGRRLEFIHVPYVHAEGGMMTYDPQTKTLFTGDVFGTFDKDWELFLALSGDCLKCQKINEACLSGYRKCPLIGIDEYHKTIMTSTAALRYCLDIIKKLDVKIIAPQHGSILRDADTIHKVIDHLYQLEKVGIDAYLGGK